MTFVSSTGIQGRAGTTTELHDNLAPLLDAMIDLPKPEVDKSLPLQMQVSNLGYNNYDGRSVIGRIKSGKLSKGMQVGIQYGTDGSVRKHRVSKVFAFSDGKEVDLEEACAGDICGK